MLLMEEIGQTLAAIRACWGWKYSPWVNGYQIWAFDFAAQKEHWPGSLVTISSRLPTQGQEPSRRWSPGSEEGWTRSSQSCLPLLLSGLYLWLRYGILSSCINFSNYLHLKKKRLTCKLWQFSSFCKWDGKNRLRSIIKLFENMIKLVEKYDEIRWKYD